MKHQMTQFVEHRSALVQLILVDVHVCNTFDAVCLDVNMPSILLSIRHVLSLNMFQTNLPWMEVHLLPPFLDECEEISPSQSGTLQKTSSILRRQSNPTLTTSLPF